MVAVKTLRRAVRGRGRAVSPLRQLGRFTGDAVEILGKSPEAPFAPACAAIPGVAREGRFFRIERPWNEQEIGGQVRATDIVLRLSFSCERRNGAGVAGPTLPSIAVLGITDFNR